jgi:hypothetical protein
MYRTHCNPFKAALFAGVMISLALMILTEDDESGPWKALRIFTYCSISANLVAAGSAIWATIYLAWMPITVAMAGDERERKCESSEANEAQRECKSYAVMYREASRILRQSANFDLQYSNAVALYGIGLILTFVAITTWVWLSTSYAERIAVLVFVVLVVPLTAWPIFRGLYLTVRGKNPWMIGPSSWSLNVQSA